MLKNFFARLFKSMIFRCMALLGCTAAIFALYANERVSRFSKDVFTDIEKTPAFNVGLVLGTSKHVGTRDNLYYKYRLQAAARLHRAGKVKKLLVSGDGSTFAACEPEQMRDDLVALGVPTHDIVLDYAGFRTLDSILRCEKVFGTREFLIISQDFHCRRALYIANAAGLGAKAFAARDVPRPAWMLRNHAREFLARSAAVIDTQLLKRQPKFYGEPIAVFP